jgi:hypothetical protein
MRRTRGWSSHWYDSMASHSSISSLLSEPLPGVLADALGAVEGWAVCEVAGAVDGDGMAVGEVAGARPERARPKGDMEERGEAREGIGKSE